MFCKIFIRTFPSTEEADLFESICKPVGLVFKTSVAFHLAPIEISKRLIFSLSFGIFLMKLLKLKSKNLSMSTSKNLRKHYRQKQ